MKEEILQINNELRITINDKFSGVFRVWIFTYNK